MNTRQYTVHKGTLTSFLIYIIKDIRIYIHVDIADQTAGPIGRNVFMYTHECSGAVKAKNIRIFFFNFFLPQATPGPSLYGRALNKKALSVPLYKN